MPAGSDQRVCQGAVTQGYWKPICNFFCVHSCMIIHLKHGVEAYFELQVQNKIIEGKVPKPLELRPH